MQSCDGKPLGPVKGAAPGRGAGHIPEPPQLSALPSLVRACWRGPGRRPRPAELSARPEPGLTFL